MESVAFVSRRLGFKGKLAVWAIAISFLIIIVSISVAGGFRREIRDGVSEIAGDIQIADIYQNFYSDTDPILTDLPFVEKVRTVKGVKSITPAVYRAGIVKTDEGIKGVLFKGIPADSSSLEVRVPSKIAKTLRLSAGDEMTAYFVGEKVRIRKFKVADIYESAIDNEENLIVYASIDDLRRLNGWEANEASALEITLEPAYRTRMLMNEKEAEVGAVCYPLIARSSAHRYGNMFDWLDLIDFNVLAILILMILVAAFNMISGLLILLFRSVSTIGTLKTMGMKDSSIAGVFLRLSSGIVLKGMAAGNIAAFLFCGIQSATRFIKLDPANYFVSYVPVELNLLQVLVADVTAYSVIMILLLIPSLFISRIDPAETVRVK